MIVIIDNLGELYIYNDKNKLNKLKLNYSVKSVICLNKNFYVLSSDNQFLLEFLYYTMKFNFSNYILNVYSINSEIINDLDFVKNPYFSYNVLFFTSCVNQRVLGELINNNDLFSAVKNINEFENQLKITNRINNNPHSFSRSNIQSFENKDKFTSSPQKRINERIVLPPNSLKKKNYDKSQEKMKRIENISSLLGNIRFDSRKYNNLNIYTFSNPKKVGNSVDVIRVNSKISKIKEKSENNINCSFLEYKFCGNENLAETVPKNKLVSDVKETKMTQCLKENCKISPNKNISFSISSPEKKLLVSNYINLSIQNETTHENIISRFEKDDSSRVKILNDPSFLKSERENSSYINVFKNTSKINNGKSVNSVIELNTNIEVVKIDDIDELIPESNNRPISQLDKNENRDNFNTQLFYETPESPIKKLKRNKETTYNKTNYIEETIKDPNINKDMFKNIDNSLRPENEFLCDSIKPECNIKAEMKDFMGKCNSNNDPFNNDHLSREDKIENISTIKLEKTHFLQKSEDPLFSTRMKLEESFPSNEMIKPEKIIKSKEQKQQKKTDNIEIYSSNILNEEKNNSFKNKRYEKNTYIDKKEIPDENMFNDSNIEKLNLNSEKECNNNVNEELIKLCNGSNENNNNQKEEPFVFRTSEDKVTFCKEYSNTPKYQQNVNIKPSNNNEYNDVYVKYNTLDSNEKISDSNKKVEEVKDDNSHKLFIEGSNNYSSKNIDLSNKNKLLSLREDLPLLITEDRFKNKKFETDQNLISTGKFLKDAFGKQNNESKLITFNKTDDYHYDNCLKDIHNQIDGSNLNSDKKINNLEEDSNIYINTNNLNKPHYYDTIPVNYNCNDPRSESLFTSAKDTSFSQTESKKNATHFLNNLTTNNVFNDNNVFQPKNKKAFSIDLRNKNLSTLIDSTKILPKHREIKQNKNSEEKEKHNLLKHHELNREDLRIGTYRSNDISKISNENQTSIFSKKRVHNSYCTIRKHEKKSFKIQNSENLPKIQDMMSVSKETLPEYYQSNKQSNIPSSDILNNNKNLVFINEDTKVNINNYNPLKKDEDKKSIDLNESNISEHFTTNNNAKVSELNNSNSLNDSLRFKNINYVDLEDKNQIINFKNDNQVKKDRLQEKEKLDCSQAENNEIMNILDNLDNNNNSKFKPLVPKEGIKEEIKFMNINDNYIISNENNNILDTKTQSNIPAENNLIRSNEIIKLDSHSDNLMNKVYKKISDKSDSPTNKTYSKCDKENKLEEMKVIEIFAELNEFYRDLRESKKIIEENLGALKKNIDIKDLKFCNEVIKEVNHDETIDVDTRAILIKNLEKFKIENVKEKLEKLFSKYKNYGNLSTDLVMCLNSFRKTDEDNKEIYSVFEPLELDKTLQTLLNCSNQISGFNFSNIKLDELIPNISSNRNINNSPSLENQDITSSKKVILKQTIKEVPQLKRKSVDKGKIMKLNEDYLKNTLKGSGSHKECSRSKSDFVSKYLKSKNEMSNNYNKNSKIVNEEMKKIRMNMNQKMNLVNKKKESPSKIEEENIKKNERDTSVEKSERDAIFKASRVHNLPYEKEIPLKSFHDSHIDKIDCFESQKLNTNPITNNNSLISSSSNNINKGFGRSSSINIAQIKSPLSMKINEIIGKNSNSNTPAKVNNVSGLNNKNEKKSIVDMLTSHFRQNNNTLSEKKMKTTPNYIIKQNSISHVKK